MNFTGRRICIAGSASAGADTKMLRYAHSLVTEITRAAISRGALLLCGVGKNPRLSADANSPALIFDWDVIEVLAEELKRGHITPETSQGHAFAAVFTSKTASQIPPDKATPWDCLITAKAVRVEYVQPGWTSGAVRRSHQTRLSDILIAIGGGEGVEHLAREFLAQGKPVIPLDLRLGASTEDGTGGAHRLFGELRADPRSFVKLTKPEALGAILSRMDTAGGTKPAAQVVEAVLDLITELLPPDAFYVRLLNPKSPEFHAVEWYFRQVVDPVVSNFGYNPVEMGRTDSTSPWINTQIFEKIHYSAVTIADLTGVRPNCFMELGYGFGRQRRMIITAKEGTDIPFDASPIEARMWNDATPVPKLMEELRDYWKRNINRPQLVSE
ncbi:MAG TPA: hypothetical protein VLT36_01895 [Candidatus Dormibacteraeota bacterium]|nr:hypothetical protein [Candidatus Dormibacteraeota bacterium]